MQGLTNGRHGKQIASGLYTYIDETKNVNEHIKALGDEVRSLSGVSDAIHKTWTRNQRVAAACASDDTELWSNVKQALDDCQIVVHRLSTKLERLKQPGKLERTFFKKPALAMRLSLKTEDIALFRQQITSHYNAMQSGLLAIQM